MRLHELKNYPVPFRDTWSTRKTFEIRVDDRKFEVGDVLHLREYDRSEVLPSDSYYTGRSVVVLVLHLLRGPAYGLDEGTVCMSTKLLVKLPVKAKS